MSVEYTHLQNGELIFCANCVVDETKVDCGFAFFSGNSPLTFTLKHNNLQVAKCELPEEVRGSVQPIAMGDIDSPITLKRVA